MSSRPVPPNDTKPFITKKNFGRKFSTLNSNGCLLDIHIFQVKTSLQSSGSGMAVEKNIISWCAASSNSYPRSHSHLKLPIVFIQVPCWQVPGISDFTYTCYVIWIFYEKSESVKEYVVSGQAFKF